jgi:hypothetical protein
MFYELPKYQAIWYTLNSTRDLKAWTFFAWLISYKLFTNNLKIMRDRLQWQKSPSRGRALDLMYIKLSCTLIIHKHLWFQIAFNDFHFLRKPLSKCFFIKTSFASTRKFTFQNNFIVVKKLATTRACITFSQILGNLYFSGHFPTVQFYTLHLQCVFIECLGRATNFRGIVRAYLVLSRRIFGLPTLK